MSRPRRMSKFPGGLSAHLGVTDRTARRYVENKFVQLYEIEGRPGRWVDLDQVDTAMAALPARTARPKGKAFKGATIVRLPAQPEVVER